MERTRTPARFASAESRMRVRTARTLDADPRRHDQTDATMRRCLMGVFL